MPGPCRRRDEAEHLSPLLLRRELFCHYRLTIGVTDGEGRFAERQVDFRIPVECSAPPLPETACGQPFFSVVT